MDTLIPPALLLLAPGIKAQKEIEPKRISNIVVRKRVRSITASSVYLRALMTRFLTFFLFHIQLL